ncbi:MAG: hypothetical protein WCF50_28075 [Pseudolabrys sp.]
MKRDILHVAHDSDVSHSTQSPAVCQLTSELADALDFRVTIEPKPKNGSRLKLQVMADKPVTVTREQTGRFGNQEWLDSELPWRLPWWLADWQCFSPVDGLYNPHPAAGGSMRHFPTPGNDIVQNRTVARPKRFELLAPQIRSLALGRGLRDHLDGENTPTVVILSVMMDRRANTGSTAEPIFFLRGIDGRSASACRRDSMTLRARDF